MTSLPIPATTTCPDFGQLLQTAVEQAFNAVIVTDAGQQNGDFCIIYCNPAFCRMTGYTATELLGRSPRLLQGPKTDPLVLQKLRECLEKGRFFQGSTVNYRKDGSSYLVEWSISPVSDAHGKVQAYVSVQQDITARVRAEQRQALLARALNATQDAVLIADKQAQILFVNQAFEELTGYGSDEVQGDNPKFLQSGERKPDFYIQLRDALARGESCNTMFTDRRRDGSIYHAAQTITLLQDETGIIQHYVSVTKDVTELVMRTQELREQAHRDALTGLLNRRAGEKRLQHCHRAAQMEGRGYALILADIDRFKSINDRFGHEEGDRMLKRCADVLSRMVRSGDAPVRWGGEEFLIVLSDCKLHAAQDLAERVRRAMAAERDVVVGTITLSLGVAAWQPGESSTALLRRTDQALYRAKADGRNQVAVAF
ncbi:MAG: diguanylate cyclase [Castellaniella sp.]|uniref:sensor domain-containing diguanylate cyclase n=1 Tax=Castellaniella sp. TaxID=1955812 RepID=UPI003C734C2B